ncbi:energy-coupling factor transporter transmembrane protein EcfT [Mycobacterium sp. ACS4331]|uniref:energy-coupling factor transporter transmembrane component T family protein n=1 Tax=Mycobacterium sp. ACS4331 TaxID=1834121 RepID=UPI0008001EAE|nr:energy-coupling factor transporter transmembrane protein EcfT [Mycobacterium sp. ACS4331]OBF12053.1 cobalt ABC transporter [Mycobacterium sp. ACS4331]
MTTLGLYQPGTSVLHRLPAGFKLLALGVLIVVMSVFVDSPARLGAAAAAVAVIVVLTRLDARMVFAQLRPVLAVVVFIFGFQVLLTDWRRAVVVCGILLLSVLLAMVVTMSTRTTDMLAALTAAMRPLGRLGLPVDRVALALALALRSIPLMVETVRQVDEARRARGLRFSARTAVAPVVVSALRSADGFAEALVARGLD